MTTTTTTTTNVQRAAVRGHSRAARWHGRRAAAAPTLADRHAHVMARAEHLAAVAAILEEMNR